MILPAQQISNSSFEYLPVISRQSRVIYTCILILIFTFFSVLPFIVVDVNIRSGGIVRPSSERTDVKSILPGIIDSIYSGEGTLVKKDCLIVRLKDEHFSTKKALNDNELNKLREFVHDLQLITRAGFITGDLGNRLISPVYRQQIFRFINQSADQEATIKKAEKELEINKFLASEKVISGKELFDKNIENEKLNALYHSFRNEQLGVWQQELTKYKSEISQISAELHQLQAERKLYNIRSPVSGTLQGIHSIYPGSTVQAGETICSISPETELVAECFIPSKDAGLVKKGQDAVFKIDAFDHNYFGILTGKIISIDNDFTLLENNPVFKIRCSFDDSQLHLKNGYSVQLKKGLTLQAIFKVTSRTLMQLLFDKLDDWIDPS